MKNTCRLSAGQEICTLSSGTILTIMRQHGMTDAPTYTNCEKMQMILYKHSLTGKFETWVKAVQDYFEKHKATIL